MITLQKDLTLATCNVKAIEIEILTKSKITYMQLTYI